MELFSKLKKMVMEPKVYSLLVRSARGQVLHIGVHFSLEEAYAAARKRMELLATHKEGEAMDIDLWNSIPIRDVITQAFDPNKIIPDPKTVPTDPVNTNLLAAQAMEIDTENMPAILRALLAGDISPLDSPLTLSRMNDSMQLPTVQDYIDEVKDAKNDLLDKLIETGDPTKLEKLGSLLTANEKRYVLKKIADKTPQSPVAAPKVDPKA